MASSSIWRHSRPELALSIRCRLGHTLVALGNLDIMERGLYYKRAPLWISEYRNGGNVQRVKASSARSPEFDLARATISLALS